MYWIEQQTIIFIQNVQKKQPFLYHWIHTGSVKLVEQSAATADTDILTYFRKVSVPVSIQTITTDFEYLCQFLQICHYLKTSLSIQLEFLMIMITHTVNNISVYRMDPRPASFFAVGRISPYAFLDPSEFFFKQ